MHSENTSASGDIILCRFPGIAKSTAWLNTPCFVGVILDGFCFRYASGRVSDTVAFDRAKAVEVCATESGIELLFVPAYSSLLSPVEGDSSVVEWYCYAYRSIDESFASMTPKRKERSSTRHCL